jgi:hypothetical protein
MAATVETVAEVIFSYYYIPGLRCLVDNVGGLVYCMYYRESLERA